MCCLTIQIEGFVHFYYSYCKTRECPKPARNPVGAGAGAKIHPQVYLRAGFFQLRGFACVRVFAKPAPASADVIPTFVLERNHFSK
jgi:hypothetical protein